MELFIKNSLNIIFGLMTSVITLLLMTTVVEVPWNGGILDSAFIYFNMSALCLILCLGIYLLFRKKQININEKYATIIAFTIPFIIGLLTLIFYKGEPTSDAQKCYNLANVIINDGMETALNSEYLKKYPFQLGYIYLFLVFKLIFNNNSILAIQIAQITIYAISNIYLLKITRILNNKSNINFSFLLLSTLWIIPVMYSIYCYGFSLGLSCGIISIYYVISYIQHKDKNHIIIGLLFSIVATFFKPNYLLLNITYLLYFIFVYKKEIKTKTIIIVICLITTLLSSKSYELLTNAIYHVNVPKGLPKTSWLVMGTVDSKEINDLIYSAYEPGRWNGYNSIRYDDLGDNFDIYVQEDIDHLKKQIAFGIENPRATLKFYYLKLANTWCVQDFMTTYTIIPQYLPLNDLVTFMNDGPGNILFTVVTRTSLIAIFIFVTLFIFKKEQFIDAYYILFIYFIGGFLYHLLFETRSVYVYPYITVLLPAVATYLSNLKPISNKTVTYSIIGCGLVLILSVGFNYLTNNYETIDGECYYNFNPQSLTINQDNFITYTFDTNNINDRIIGFEIQATGDLINNDIIVHIEGDNFDTYIKNNPVVSNDNQHYRFTFNDLKLSKNKEYTLTLIPDSIRFTNESIEIVYGQNSDINRKVTINGQTFENSTLNFKFITSKHTNPLITDDKAKQSIPLIWQAECLNIANK